MGIDGVCGAGKSTFARELVAELVRLGRPAVHLDSDGFHHVRARRRRNSDDQARGYYDDAYDLEAVAERVLRPLGPGGDRRYAVAVHDLETDAVLTDVEADAAEDVVVVFDATFLQRGRLREHWDEVVFLRVDEAVATQRGVDRDAAALGGTQEARAAYDRRYMAACRLYLAEEDPERRASIVLDHTDPSRPMVVRLGT
ncbi:AAA family ATPase [Aeromicrobium alkaliterrae]|uniref:AAA family ATPase n=1 Tax=Aeromicrobium alkaliterrae TaxID=302168 RepID=UPI0031CF0690